MIARSVGRSDAVSRDPITWGQQRQGPRSEQRAVCGDKLTVENIERKFGGRVDCQIGGGSGLEPCVREGRGCRQPHRPFGIGHDASDNVEPAAQKFHARDIGGAPGRIGWLCEFLSRRQARPELQSVAATARLFGVQYAAPGTNPLGVARAEPIPKTHAVSMLHATFKQVTDDLDAGMGMRLVADAAQRLDTVVVDENERADGIAIVCWKRSVEQHIAVIDHALRRQYGIYSTVHRHLSSCGIVHARCSGGLACRTGQSPIKRTLMRGPTTT